MSSLSPKKFTENLPVSGVIAFSQAAVGFGLGLLIADRLKEGARQKMALALIGAGIAACAPMIAGVVSTVKDRPESSSSMRRRLEGIRRGFSGGDETF